MTYRDGAVWRKRLLDDLGDQGDVSALLDHRTDEELSALMENLRGNCVETIVEIFKVIDHDRPTCLIAYTIKGWGTPIAGHKDNHGGLMGTAQMDEWQQHMGMPKGQEWEPFACVVKPGELKNFLKHFGQTGSIGDLYGHFGIDAAGILKKVDALTDGRPVPAIG